MADLYALVGTIERARFMLEAGVPYLQLRFKAQPLTPYLDEIRGWRARYPACRVIVNDDLDAAVAAQAWGVHLGQEDADRYAPERLKAAVREHRLALGISTHNDAELARAKSLGADHVGFGPLFDTRGQVVGVTNMKIQGGEGLGFAIPVRYVVDFLRNREAFAYNSESSEAGYRYLQPPSRQKPDAPAFLKPEKPLDSSGRES